MHVFLIGYFLLSIKIALYACVHACRYVLSMKLAIFHGNYCYILWTSLLYFS